ncbi:alpha/beta-hydrolase [Alternaria alternata]|nr:alpha/beta-hydrolase [Alternaria alternata]
MPHLTVPGAVLHYEVFGAGKPLFVFIPGADGRGSIFHPAAKLLATYYTTVCWDRRGYSQSYLVDAQDFQHRLQTDADDAHRLIQHLSPKSGATVFGTSSGAVVAQQLLSTHPESVEKLISHEPPSFSLLCHEKQVQGRGLIDHVYNTYRSQGYESAMSVFTSGLSNGPEAEIMRSCMDAKRGDEIRANCLFWFEFELRQYTGAEVDIEGLRRSKDKLVLVAGEDSGDGPNVEPIRVLSKELQVQLLRVPGGHLGYAVDPAAFVRRLLDLRDSLRDDLRDR